MDSPSAWYQLCACGRTFSVLQAYSYHKHSCQKTKKRLASALEKAKEVWETKKRRKTEATTETLRAEGVFSPHAVADPTIEGDAGLPPFMHTEVSFHTSATGSLTCD